MFRMNGWVPSSPTVTQSWAKPEALGISQLCSPRLPLFPCPILGHFPGLFDSLTPPVFLSSVHLLAS